MIRSKAQRRTAATGARVALASAALALAFAPPALSMQRASSSRRSNVKTPAVMTGLVGRQHKTGVLTLEGVINPHGSTTTYYFQYGPTITYGKQTPTESLLASNAKVKISQPVSELVLGDHYRLLASNAFGTVVGRDEVYGLKRGASPFEIPSSPEPTPYRHTFVLSGTLTGSGSGHRELVLEETPYPYTRSFTPVGVPVETNAVGAFTFIVRRLSISTEFRITTATAPQLFSPIVTEHVTVRVTLKASARGHSLARLYGSSRRPRSARKCSCSWSSPRAKRPARRCRRRPPT